MIIDFEGIGAKIKYFRTQKGLSQEELAEFVDVSPVYISNIERGEKAASLKVIIALANALNVSTDVLLADNLNGAAGSFDQLQFQILADCSKEEHDIIIESMNVLKTILRRYKVSK